MDLKIAASFSWLILLAFLARPVCMQIFWNAESVCSDVRGPLCYPTDPIHQWDVTVNCSAADSVRVVYANYSSEDNMVLGDISFQEIRLHCTAPGGTAQAEVMPASVNCSGTSTGGNWRDDGFVFQNLGAAGIQSGWTCTIGGCFVLSRMVDGQDVWINTPSIEFVLRSGHCDLGVGPSSTVEPVTTLPTTAETMTLHTTVNTATTGKGVNAGTGNAVTHNDSDATTTSTQSVTTVAKMEPDTTGTKLLIIGSCTAIILLALMMLTTITVLMLVIYWKVWTVPATSIFVVEKNNAQSNEVCQVELGSESIKVSAINMDEKY